MLIIDTTCVSQGTFVMRAAMLLTSNRIFLCVMFAVFTAACTPTVKVQAPDEPITINLNVKIEHEIRVKVEKDIDDLFSEKGGLF